MGWPWVGGGIVHVPWGWLMSARLQLTYRLQLSPHRLAVVSVSGELGVLAPAFIDLARLARAGLWPCHTCGRSTQIDVRRASACAEQPPPGAQPPTGPVEIDANACTSELPPECIDSLPSRFWVPNKCRFVLTQTAGTPTK